MNLLSVYSFLLGSMKNTVTMEIIVQNTQKRYRLGCKIVVRTRHLTILLFLFSLSDFG
jgi:hypothetical protein